MLNLLLWIIFGGVVGWLASIAMGTNQQQGVFANVFVGILGVLIGGFVGQAAGIGDVTGFNLSSFLLALGGAIILLGVVRVFSRLV